MKYPQQQFDLLVKSLQILSNHFENIQNIHPCQLQYLVYQQASEGQRHNAFCINEAGNICRHYYVNDLGLTGYVPLIDFLNADNFPLYPEGCNDSHIETAVKKALNQLNLVTTVTELSN